MVRTSSAPTSPKANFISDQSRLGSLVFGGYDQSRIEGVPVQFDMGPPALTELAVSVSSIVIDGKSTGVASTQHTFTAIVDSTLPYLFLPNATCDWLAKQLNLQFDDLAELYIIDPTSLRYNMGNITSIAITLGPTNSSPPSSNLTIRFPYDAFNSNASWVWGWESQQHIFPIKRAPSSIAVLGRVFFQEAYVIVDYDRNNFSISQTTNSTSLLEARSKAQAANISFPSLTNITSIHSKNATDPSSTKLGMGTIAGIVIGIILGISLVVALFWLFIIKPKRQEKKRKEEEAAEKTENTDGIRTISELTAKPSHRKHMPEAQNFDSEIHEMEQNSKPGELDGNAVAELEQKPAELEGNHAHAHADPERADADAGVGTRGEQVETDHTTSRDGP
jgi:hypothetical protein